MHWKKKYDDLTALEHLPAFYYSWTDVNELAFKCDYYI